MKRMNIEIALLLFFMCMFFGADSFFSGNALFISKIVCGLISCADVYLILMEYEKYREQHNLSRQSEIENFQKKMDILTDEQKRINRLFEEFDHNVKMMIQELSEEENCRSEALEKGIQQNTEKLIAAEKESKEGCFDTLENKIREIINVMIEEQNRNSDCMLSVLKENMEMNEKYVELLNILNNEQKEMIQNEIKIRESNDELHKNIVESIGSFVTLSTELKDQLSALKTYVADFSKKVDARLGQHYENIDDAIKDGADDIRDAWSQQIKKQAEAYEKQTSALTDSVNHMEEVLAREIGQVLSANTDLIKYLETVQDEWTSLNKAEIEFLSKVWDEK